MFLEPHTGWVWISSHSPTSWKDPVQNTNDAGQHTGTWAAEYGSFGESHLLRSGWHLFTVRPTGQLLTWQQTADHGTKDQKNVLSPGLVPPTGWGRLVEDYTHEHGSEKLWVMWATCWVRVHPVGARELGALGAVRLRNVKTTPRTPCFMTQIQPSLSLGFQRVWSTDVHIGAPFLSHMTGILLPPPHPARPRESSEKPFPKYLLKSLKKQ